MFNKIKKNKFIFITLIVFSMIFVTTFGRFVYIEVKNHFISTRGFYFESDKLRTVKAVYQVSNYNGVDNYNVTINLNSFVNNLKKANVDIEYELSYSCSAKATCGLSKNGGIIYAASNSDNFTATIAPTAILNDKETIWIDIVATAKEPYTKTISATFILKVGFFGLSHEIVDSVGSPFFELKITNTLDYYTILEAFGSYSINDRIDIPTYLALPLVDKNKCASSRVDLDFDPNLLLMDMTNPAYLSSFTTTTTNISGHDYINSIHFKIDSNSSLVVRFYKRNAGLNYTYPIVNPSSIVNVTYY